MLNDGGADPLASWIVTRVIVQIANDSERPHNGDLRIGLALALGVASLLTSPRSQAPNSDMNELKEIAMIKSKLLLVPVLLLMASLSACGVASGQPQLRATPSATLEPTSPSVTPSADDPVLPLFPYAPEGNMAHLSGVLVVEGRCLYVVAQATDERWLPLVPDTASWEEGGLNLDGERFEVGDTVSMGGGETKNIENVRLLQAPHPSCDTRNLWRTYLGVSTAR